MTESSTLSLYTKRYFPDHPDYSEIPYSNVSVDIEVDFTHTTFEIEYRKEKEEGMHRSSTNSYLYFECCEEKLLKLLSFLTKDKPEDSSTNSKLTLHVRSGLCRYWRNSQNKKESPVDHLMFVAESDRLVVETFGGENPFIPYYKVEQGSTPQDNKNLLKIENFAQRLMDRLQDDDILVDIRKLPTDVKNKLTETEYGEEVLHHLSDARKCLNHDQLHLALTSYIHAIEWAIISYLKSAEDLDIIEQEKDGQLYSFAVGKNSLLDELTNHQSIDQKTISRIESMNKAERRWAAHHKDGEVLQKEVEAIQHRLVELLEQLYRSG